MNSTPFSLINEVLERFFTALNQAFNQIFALIGGLLSAFL